MPSYLTAWPSRDLIRASHQQITREWCENRRKHFDIHISQFVIDEASAGDVQAAADRIAILKEFPLLDITEEVDEIATELLNRLSLPPRAATDAAHIALAAVHEMHFLLTWNCTHIANAEMAQDIEQVCSDFGLECPVVCTPEELMGG